MGVNGCFMENMGKDPGRRLRLLKPLRGRNPGDTLSRMPRCPVLVARVGLVLAQLMSMCGSSTLKDRVDVSSCLTHLVQPLEVVCGNPRFEPAMDKLDVSRCAGMHERLGNGRGCMAAVRGQQSRGCGSERQVVPFLSWLTSGGALRGKKTGERKGAH